MAKRRRRVERRGRPRKVRSVAPREIVDRGSPELLEQRRRVTGSPDLPADLAGALYGRGELDFEEYRALCVLAELLRLVRRGLGLSDGGVSGEWANILAGARTGRGLVPPGAERARRILVRIRGEIAPGVWACMTAVADGFWPSTKDRAARFLLVLRVGLAYLARRIPRLIAVSA